MAPSRRDKRSLGKQDEQHRPEGLVHGSITLLTNSTLLKRIDAMTTMFFLVFMHFNNIMYQPFGTALFILLSQASLVPPGLRHSLGSPCDRPPVYEKRTSAITPVRATLTRNVIKLRKK